MQIVSNGDNLFSGKNKKNISICRLLKILPRVSQPRLLRVGCAFEW